MLFSHQPVETLTRASKPYLNNRVGSANSAVKCRVCGVAFGCGGILSQGDDSRGEVNLRISRMRDESSEIGHVVKPVENLRWRDRKLNCDAAREDDGETQRRSEKVQKRTDV
jgi:hypothetical protein